jgi:hypothetical protein
MEYVTQSFLDLSWLRQDSWKCHLRFIASKHSFNPQLFTRIKADFMICICCNVKVKFKQKYKSIQILLAQGQPQGSALTTHQQALTTVPFGNTCKADAVSPEVAIGGCRT